MKVNVKSLRVLLRTLREFGVESAEIDGVKLQLRPDRAVAPVEFIAPQSRQAREPAYEATPENVGGMDPGTLSDLLWHVGVKQ